MATLVDTSTNKIVSTIPLKEVKLSPEILESMSQYTTQMQLAEKSEISRNHLQRIETATCSSSLDTLIDIANALNIPLKKLFEFKD